MNYRTLVLCVLGLASIAAAQSKPISLHPRNPRYFEFRGKPAVLITSGEHYGAALNLDFDYVKYLDELAKHGLNQTRTFSGTYFEIPESFDITDNTLSPKAGRYIGPWKKVGEKYDLTQYDEKYFERLKDFVSKAGERGIVVEYVLFCTLYNDKLFDVSPMNPKNTGTAIGDPPRREVFTLKHKELNTVQEAFVRKVVAELKDFDNVYYEICNEPYFEGVADDWQARIAAVITEAEKDFANKHLIAQNIANDKKKVEKPDKNVHIFNFHYATPPDTVEMNAHLNRPIGDDETGFKGREDVYYRTEGWDFMLAGGAAYSNLDYSFTPGHPDGSLTDFKSPGGGGVELRKQLSILKKFIEGHDFVNMKPMNEVVARGRITSELGGKANQAKATRASIRALGSAGNAYAIYVRGGSSAELELSLPEGEYTAQWLDTRTGEYKLPLEFKHSGGTRVIASPDYQDDIALSVVARPKPIARTGEARLLYVATPGVRNYLEYGGHGVLVFDMNDGHKFIKRIPTAGLKDGKPWNVKGIAAARPQKRLYISTPSTLQCLDLATEKLLWERAYERGCDRMSITPDGMLIYLPTFESDYWHVVDARSGDVMARLTPRSGAHNTVISLNGQRAFLGGLRSPMMTVAETNEHLPVQKIGPFGGGVRPFTVNGKGTLVYVCVNELLGFEIGDVQSGKVLHRIEVADHKKGAVKRHGCPSHGVGLTPDEKEVWVVDATNKKVHIFDNTVMPPRQVESVQLKDEPGWITFSLDGVYAYPSTGEVIDVKTRKIVATLKDEEGREVMSEKMIEIQWDGMDIARVGDQFGVGRKK